MFVDPIQPSRNQYNNLPSNINKITKINTKNEPFKTDFKRIPSTTTGQQEEDTLFDYEKVRKYDFVNHKKNTGKNCCDHFWWGLIAFIIFAYGAYVSS